MGEQEKEIVQKPDEMNLLVAGYEFATIREAQEARKELRNIQALKEKIDFSKKKNLFEIYKRLVEKRAFRTLVGLQFLGEFRDYLIDTMKYKAEEVPYIQAPSGNGRFRSSSGRSGERLRDERYLYRSG